MYSIILDFILFSNFYAYFFVFIGEICFYLYYFEPNLYF